MRIALCIFGASIAIDAPSYVGQFIRDGHEVRIVLSPAAEKFVSRPALEYLGALVEDPSRSNPEEVGRWCDRAIGLPITRKSLGLLAYEITDGPGLVTLAHQPASTWLFPHSAPSWWGSGGQRTICARLRMAGFHLIDPKPSPVMLLSDKSLRDAEALAPPGDIARLLYGAHAR